MATVFIDTRAGGSWGGGWGGVGPPRRSLTLYDKPFKYQLSHAFYLRNVNNIRVFYFKDNFIKVIVKLTIISSGKRNK